MSIVLLAKEDRAWIQCTINNVRISKQKKEYLRMKYKYAYVSKLKSHLLNKPSRKATAMIQ